MSRPLLKSVRFLPLFAAQSLGALNDNLFKNALVVLILYRASAADALLVPLSAGIFIAPYMLLSATAGQLADRFDKARLIRLAKLFEILLMALAAAGFMLGSVPVLLAVLAGLGVQAAFFSPLKFGILPDHLAERELVEGNALIEAGTFGGILVGTIAGGALILLPGGPGLVGGLGLAAALAGAVAGFRVPPAPAASPELKVSWNILAETWALVRQARASRPIWLSILGLSWFWNFGAVLLAEFPVVAKDVLGAGSPVVTLLLTVFAVGVGAGSILAGRLLQGEVSPRHVPFAALGLSLFTADFAWACQGASLATAGAVLTHPAGWRILADLFALALSGGVYSVPLYALIQDKARPDERARMIAANNVVNAAVMAAGAAAAAGLAAAGLSAPGILAVMALVNLAVAAEIIRLLPREIMRAALRWYFATLHGVTIRGLEHYRTAGPRRVIVINHLSLLDGCFVAAFLPGEVTFAVNTHVATRWWARLFLAFVRVFPIDPANPYAIKGMIRTVRDGTPLAIFPEGRLTRTGALMKIYEGAGTVAEKADAAIVPVRIDGLQFTRVSGLGAKVRQRWFPRLTLEIQPPTRLAVDPALRGRARRRVVGTALQDVMIGSAFAAARADRSLFAAFLDARRRFGGSVPIVEDTARTPLSYRRLLLGAVVLGRRLARQTAPGETVGVLLPNANGAVATLLGLWAFARVPQLLNFSAGADAILATCRATGVRTVIGSRAFVERAKLGRTVELMAGELSFVWLEDLRAAIGPLARLRGLWDAALARRLPGSAVDPSAPAVVLATSGSEGAPKAVLHSHRSLLANCAQLGAVIDFSPADRVMNAMPIFHSFGLTGGTILPLLAGVKIFLYPSPLHYKIVPELAYDSDATILFGTDTFLAGWARFAHPYDFYAVRYIFAGAEKLRDETRRLYMERFGVRVLEGYGATETAPALAINTAMHNRAGSVGRLLPGIDWRLEPVPGVEQGGRLQVRGPNVMLGYMRVSAPGVLEPPEAGWYDTGDIVRVDEAGFLTIVGRVKRFAKIAGEMVSMPAAEALAAAVWPGSLHAVVALPDARKGEQLVLVTTEPAAAPAALIAAARERGLAELLVPRLVRAVDAIPLLGTGKIDYPAVQRLAAA